MMPNQGSIWRYVNVPPRARWEGAQSGTRHSRSMWTRMTTAISSS